MKGAPIRMLWVRGELSRLEILSIRSFLGNGHPVHLYTYERPGNVPEGATICDASDIVPESLTPAVNAQPFKTGSYACFSDYFRYCLLDMHGGWWADIDYVCLRPWRFSQEALTAATFEPGYGRIANNSVLYFPAGHPVVKQCRETCEKLDLRAAGMDQTGPLMLHETLRQMGLLSLCESPDVFCPVPWNASWQFVRPLWMRCTLDELKQRIARPHLTCRFTRRTVAMHLWNETWRHTNRDKNAVWPRSCLYERAQRRWNKPATS